jgi:hypothetical protein
MHCRPSTTIAHRGNLASIHVKLFIFEYLEQALVHAYYSGEAIETGCTQAIYFSQPV